jgi:Ulp1 family protease
MEQRQLFRERMATELDQELVTFLMTFDKRDEREVLFTLGWYDVTPLRLSRLASNKWMDNETINFTMDLLADKHQIQKRTKSSLILHSIGNNVHLNHHSKWKPAFMTTLQGKKIDKYWKLKSCDLDKIYVPFHQNNNHWILGIVEMGKLTIRIFDSCHGSDNELFEAALLKWIENELTLQDQRFDSSFWRVTHENGPRQTNTYDCGLFVLAAAEMEMMKVGHIYDQFMMPYLRLRVGCEILACHRQQSSKKSESCGWKALVND